MHHFRPESEKEPDYWTMLICNNTEIILVKIPWIYFWKVVTKKSPVLSSGQTFHCNRENVVFIYLFIWHLCSKFTFPVQCLSTVILHNYHLKSFQICLYHSSNLILKISLYFYVWEPMFFKLAKIWKSSHVHVIPQITYKNEKHRL